MKILIDSRQLEQRIGELAREIAAAYPTSPPLFVGILNGAAQFMMALIGHLPEKILERLEYDFVDVSSYQGKERTGQVKLTIDLSAKVAGRDILLVDGIIDTGRSLDFVRSMLEDRCPLSLKVCTLLNKNTRREFVVQVDYCGFEIEDLFVVGYGMDYDQRYRALRHVAVIE